MAKATKKRKGDFEILVSRVGGRSTDVLFLTDRATIQALQPWTAQALFDVENVDPKMMAAD